MNELNLRNKKVIYTAMTGQYDKIFQPSVIAKGFDYIMFTNDLPEQKHGIWQIRNIPYQNSNNTKVARWVKTHPHILLSEYDVSLWHDGNVEVDSPQYFNRINKLISDKILIASMDHIHRHCIYDEAFEIIYLNLDRIGKVLREIAHIKHDGYPINNGLIETNCILRHHNDPKVIQFCENWWTMIDRYSLRDQLSCNYVSWKFGLEIVHILPNSYSTRNHPSIHCNKHVKKINLNDIIWYGSLKDRFAERIHNHYNRFINSKNYSLKENFSYIIIIAIRKYFSLVVIKYKLGTWLKTCYR